MLNLVFGLSSAELSLVNEFEPDVIVGSSRGGAVAMAAHPSEPLILIAPAWKKYAPWATISSTATILHSVDDAVIAFSDSEELSKSFGAKLYNVGEDHFMSDNEALHALLDAVSVTKT